MNKKTKKLLLSRETLRNLQGNELSGVAGGVTIGLRCVSEQCTGTCDQTITCYTCEWTCTQTNSGCPSNWTTCC